MKPTDCTQSIAIDYSEETSTTECLGSAVKKTNVVLVGEDTPSTLYVISSCLKFDNHAVETATDGEEIVNKALKIKPDIIMLDIMLPGCNGLNLISSIKGPLPDTKVSIMSVIDDKKVIQKAINLGASDYLIKPVCPEMLTHKVNLLAGRFDENIEGFRPCNLKIMLRGKSSIISGMITMASPYMLKIHTTQKPRVDQIYRFRSIPLNKIMERKGDLFARVIEEKDGCAYLEMLAITSQESRKLKMFITSEQRFSDSSFFN